MAINYEPPQPVAPATSAAYGASQEYDRMAPIIQGYRAQQLQAGIAGAQAYNQGIGDVTQRTVAAGQQNTQLEALYQNQRFQQQQQQAEQAQRAAMQSAQMEQQAAEQRSQQEQQQRMLQQHMDTQFSQSQELQRQKYEQADSWIDQQVAAGTLDRETAINMKSSVRDLRTPLELAKMKSDTAQQQARAKEYESQAMKQKQIALQAAKIDAMSLDERTKHTYNPAVLARVLQDLGPRSDGSGPMGTIAQQLYDKTAKQRVEADENGIMATHILQSDGKLIEVKSNKHVRADGLPSDALSNPSFTSMINQEKARIDSYVNQFKKTNEGAFEWWSQEKKNEKLAHDVRLRLGMPQEANWDTPPTYDEYESWMKYKASRPATRGSAFNPGSTPAAQGGAGGPSPVSQTGPAGNAGQSSPPDRYENRTPQPPFQRDEHATTQQKEQIKLWNDIIKRVGDDKNNRQAAEWATARLRDFGSLEAIQKQSPATYARYMEILRGLTLGHRQPDANPDQNPYGGVPIY